MTAPWTSTGACTYCGSNNARDAKAWEAEVTRRKRLGSLAQLDGGAQTLEVFIRDSWGPDRAQGLASATRTSYASLYRAHIEKEFGRAPLRDITAPRVASWRTARQRAGAGVKALREAHSLLGGILGYACELGELQFNAARAVRPTRRDKPERSTRGHPVRSSRSAPRCLPRRPWSSARHDPVSAPAAPTMRRLPTPWSRCVTRR